MKRDPLKRTIDGIPETDIRAGRDPLFHDDPPAPKKRRRRTPKKDSEAAVLRECMIYLKKCPDTVFTERRNTGAVAFEGGGFIRFGTPGAADIWCLIQRTWECPADVFFEHTTLEHIEIECKRRDGKGRLSSAQQAFKQFCEKFGIPYFVVTSATDLDEQLKKAGFLS